ncbi:MAG: hypothetical protein ACXAEF_09800 [Candidatus Thorarchaeota archaeon]|jgi:hypothetical protein
MSTDTSELDAVFLYMGILDAYEAVGVELIGPNVLDEHVLPRMVYYVKEFLPEIFSDRGDSGELVAELKTFIVEFSSRVHTVQGGGSGNNFTMEEIWKLRAAIFGYESVFIDILGEAAIRDYVFIRMSDILSSYLPSELMDPSIPLGEKLDGYSDYIKNNGFVEYARVKVGKDEITVAANKCAFSKIHDSDAYNNLNVRFCPWGMIASAIIAGHEGKETVLKSSTFTTEGSVSEIQAK